MKRRLNWKRSVVLLVACLCGGLVIHFAHGFQVNRQAGGLITQADRAEKERQYRSAIDYLRRYLGFQPRDTDVLARYGRLLARTDVATTPRARFQAISILESALARDPALQEERQLVIDLFLSLHGYKDAQFHLDYLLKNNPNDPKLLGKLAKCHESLNHFREARKAYQEAIKQKG